MPKSYFQQREDDLKIKIAAAKVNHNLTNEGLAKKLGMPVSSLSKKTCHPGDLRGHQIWMIEKLAEH